MDEKMLSNIEKIKN